ncbi:restriction endonuclease subunit S [Patescibacteria group bacterium]|nr:restriction endonuclease subunit S [Patescibacteria group bacterium]
MLNSIVNHSVIQNTNRLDAEFFQPKFLKLQKKLRKGKYKKLGEVCVFINTGPAGSNLLASLYTTNGIKVLRPSNLDGWNCGDGNSVFISKENCKKNNLQIYENEDLLIARVGDVKFGIIETVANGRYTISPNLFALRPKRDLINPYFLLAFLNTKFGLPQIQRGKKLASLASIGIEQIANILIPALPLKKQIKIGKVVKRGLKKIQSAKTLYSKAENILLKRIGFDKIETLFKDCHSERPKGVEESHTTNFHSTSVVLDPSTRLRLGRDDNRSSIEINITKVREKRRADAEYFLAQKYNIGKSIKSIQIGEIAQIFRGIEPGRKAYQKSGKLFLRVSNIGKYGLLEKSQKYISNDLYEKLRGKYQPRIGEVLLIKDGKPGVALTISKPIEGIISEGIVRLKLDTSLTAEYISLCVNSLICRSQINADIDGSLVPHWKIEQMKKLRIPIIPPKERKILTDNIKKSTKFFQESKNNLRQAVKQVENLINNIL